MTHRRLWQLAALLWLSVAATAVLFYAFWRWEHLAPHALWGVGTAAIIGSIGIALVGGATWRAVEGPRRRAAVAIAILGLTPVVWFGLFTYRTQMNVLERQRVGSMSVLPVLGLWASSLIDAQTRWQYPRRVDGKHATLIDDGQLANPQELLEQLDEHITRMAQELGQQPSPAKVRWVRGSALGLTGHSVIDWAICDGVEETDSLSYLDRHEAAHATITCLSGVDQNPPALLGEGWAEYQSADRDAQLRYLASPDGVDARVPLAELISREWYLQMDGPVYWEGGPLVRYLIERFGGPKFFDLYRGVREETFAADVERILGVSWTRLEADFWKWVEDEGAKLPPANPDEATADDRPAWQVVELSELVDPKHWRTIVDGYRAAKKRQFFLPTDVTLMVEVNDVDQGTGAPSQPPTIFRGAFRRGHVWMIAENGPDDGEALFHSPDRALERASGASYGSEISSERGFGAPLQMWRRYPPTVDTGAWLPLHDYPLTHQGSRIEMIVPPAGNDSRWNVIVTWPTPNGEMRCVMELDAALAWRVRKLRVTLAGERYMSFVADLAEIEGNVLPTKFEITHSDGSRAIGALRELSPSEEGALRHDVELAVRLPWKWPAPLRAATTWAILWPLAGVTLWGLDRRSQRRLAPRSSRIT